MTNKIIYYRIEDAYGYHMIEFAITRLLGINSNTVTLKFNAYDNVHIDMFVSKSAPEINDGWGKLYTRRGDEFIPIEKLRKRDTSGDVPLFLTVYENQVEELNLQLAEKLADFNTTQVEYQQEMDAKHAIADELLKHLEAEIENYPTTHPLTGSEKQIDWANKIRDSAFTSLVYDDPDNAEMRIQRTLDNPERRKAKFWIDNRKSFGY